MKISLQQKLNYSPSTSLIDKNKNYLSIPYKNNNFPAFKAGVGIGYLTYKIARGVYKSGEKVKVVHNHLTKANNLWRKKGDLNALYEALRILAALETNYDEKFSYYLYDLFANEKNFSIKEMKKKALVDGIHRIDKSDPEGIFVVTNFMESLYGDKEYYSEDYIKAFASLPDEKFSDFKKNTIDKFLYSNSLDSNGAKSFTYNMLLLKTLDKDYYNEFIKKREKTFSKIPNKMMNIVLSEFKKEKNLAYNYYIKEDYKYGQLKDPMWEDFLQYTFYSIALSDYKNISKLAKNLNINEEFATDIAKDIETEILVQKAETQEEKMQIYRERIIEKANSRLHRFDLFSCVESYIKQNPYKEIFLKEFEETLSNLQENAFYASDVSDYDCHPTML